MKDELLKKIQNVEVKPSQRANDLFEERLWALPKRKNGILSRNIAAAVLIAGLSSLIYVYQMSLVEGKRELAVVTKKQLEFKDSKEDIPSIQYVVPKEEVSKSKRVQVEKNVIEIFDSLEKLGEENLEKKESSLALLELEKIEVSRSLNLQSNYDPLNVLDKRSKALSNVVKVGKEEEVRKSDLIVQELMLLKYGEIIDEKATIAKLFTREDNLLLNEANELRSRVLWIKNKWTRE